MDNILTVILGVNFVNIFYWMSDEALKQIPLQDKYQDIVQRHVYALNEGAHFNMYRNKDMSQRCL